ncbi:MAG TPA: substrate-binding domain-containing protein, partial [Usitatibacter sp.]|nr:substrate-binding domain-containing protein [Usitatibacter sp.]
WRLKAERQSCEGPDQKGCTIVAFVITRAQTRNISVGTLQSQATFDELKLGVQEIESLSDPKSGEVRIACAESIAAGILPAVIQRFFQRFPKVRLSVFQTTPALTGFAALHERDADAVFTLMPRAYEKDLGERLQAEVLFHDRVCLAAGRQTSWARRRRIAPAELAGAQLISPASDTPGGAAVVEALRAAGVPGPQVMTFSVHLRTILSLKEPFVAVLPASILRFNPGRYPLKELAVDLPMPRPPALLVTLRNRTLSPPVQRFIECAREVARLKAD